MIEHHVYCDVCGQELTDQYPGEDYTTVTVREARQRYHEASEEVNKEYHLCSDEVEPYEWWGEVLFRAKDTVPMMLETKHKFQYLTRVEFEDRFTMMADALESVWRKRMEEIQ